MDIYIHTYKNIHIEHRLGANYGKSMLWYIYIYMHIHT